MGGVAKNTASTLSTWILRGHVYHHNKIAHIFATKTHCTSTMKICFTAATLVAICAPFASGQSSAPSTADAIDSLAPSTAPLLESLVPTSSLPLESVTPTDAPTVPPPTPGVASPAPTPAESSLPLDSLAPSASTPIIESLVPTSVEQIESLTPTEPEVTQGIDPQCSAHAECLMIGMDGDCCPTSTGTFLDCCDTEVPVTTATPLDVASTVLLTPTNYPGCMKVNGNGNDDDFLILATCNSADIKQQLKFVGSSIQLGMDDTKCLQAGRMGTPSQGKYIRVYPCDSSNDLQSFSWDSPSGRLYPTNYPEVVVVFRGTNANLNADRIILADPTEAEVSVREDWEILS